MLEILLASLLLAQAPAATPAAAKDDVAAEVERGTAAYNAQDLAFYEKTLAADAVYIADDGAVFAGKEKVLGLFKRLFARTPPPQLAVSDVVTGRRGDVAWARFKWTLSGGAKARDGVATALFAKTGDGWQALSIQNTPSGHAPASPRPGATPSPSPHKH